MFGMHVLISTLHSVIIIDIVINACTHIMWLGAHRIVSACGSPRDNFFSSSLDHHFININVLDWAYDINSIHFNFTKLENVCWNCFNFWEKEKVLTFYYNSWNMVWFVAVCVCIYVWVSQPLQNVFYIFFCF